MFSPGICWSGLRVNRINSTDLCDRKAISLRRGITTRRHIGCAPTSLHFARHARYVEAGAALDSLLRIEGFRHAVAFLFRNSDRICVINVDASRLARNSPPSIRTSLGGRFRTSFCGAPEHSWIRDCRAIRRKRLPRVFAAYLGRWHGILARSHPDVTIICSATRTESGRIESWNCRGFCLWNDARLLSLAHRKPAMGDRISLHVGLLRELHLRRSRQRTRSTRTSAQHAPVWSSVDHGRQCWS